MLRQIETPDECHGRNRVRSAAEALLVGLVCYVVAIPSSDFHLDPTMMGIDYQAMSVDPLSGRGPYPERVLSPLLAWLLGMSGPRYGIFSHGLLVVFLGAAYRLTMIRSGDRIWSIAFTCALSLSAMVGTYRGLVGYSDPLTFCLLCVCIRWIECDKVFWAMLALGLLNHPQTVFLWPWLAYERHVAAKLSWRDAAYAATAIATYTVCRLWLLRATEDSAAQSFYGARLNVQWYLQQLDWLRAVELCVLVPPCIVFVFGFMFVVLLWDLAGREAHRARIAAALLFAGIFAMLVIAIDVFRFVALLGLPMIVAMHRRFVPDGRARTTLIAAIGLSIAFRSLNINLGYHLLGRLTHHQLAGLRHPTLSGLVPEAWPILLGYVAFLALLVVVAARTKPGQAKAERPCSQPAA